MPLHYTYLGIRCTEVLGQNEKIILQLTFISVCRFTDCLYEHGLHAVARGKQNRALRTLEVELQEVVSHHMVSGN